MIKVNFCGEKGIRRLPFGACLSFWSQLLSRAFNFFEKKYERIFPVTVLDSA
jgi:hypothetical protein